MLIVDARGQLCPQPVMMTKEVVDRGARELEVLVSEEVPKANVTRFLKGQGFEVVHSQEGDHYVIRATLAADADADSGPDIALPPVAVKVGQDYSLLILSETLGQREDGLGEVLMKSFLGAVKSREVQPSTIALMNGGVKLALAESTCSETLKELGLAGVTILVCGTCTKHFGITESVAVGNISNMFEITEAVFAASKPMVIGN